MYPPMREQCEKQLHPAFLEYLGVYRECTEAQRQIWKLGIKGDPEREVAVRYFTRLAEINQKYRDIPHSPLLSVIYVAPDRTPWESLAQWLFWKRHGQPLWQATEKAQDGDQEASKAIRHLLDELDALRFGDGESLKHFKVKLEHSDLLEAGLQFRIENLTGEELANLFDKFCPCGQTDKGRTHNGDGLKRQLRSLLKTVGNAQNWERNPPASFVARRAKRLSECGCKRLPVRVPTKGVIPGPGSQQW